MHVYFRHYFYNLRLKNKYKNKYNFIKKNYKI